MCNKRIAESGREEEGRRNTEGEESRNIDGVRAVLISGIAERDRKKVVSNTGKMNYHASCLESKYPEKEKKVFSGGGYEKGEGK